MVVVVVVLVVVVVVVVVVVLVGVVIVFEHSPPISRQAVRSMQYATEQAMMEQGAGCHMIRCRRWVFSQVEASERREMPCRA